MKVINTFESFLDAKLGHELGEEPIHHQEEMQGGADWQDRYMFFGNLKTIKRDIEAILAMDPAKVNEILKDGHAWAEDHIATSKDDIQEVADFLIGEVETMKTNLIQEEPSQIMEDLEGEADQVLDVRATLTHLRNQVEGRDGVPKSKVKVILANAEDPKEAKREVLRMPMLDVITLVGGGQVRLPRTAEDLVEVIKSIIVDDNPNGEVELFYKDAPPIQKPYEPSPEEIKRSKQEWEERWGPGGGPMTFWGRRTGD